MIPDLRVVEVVHGQGLSYPTYTREDVVSISMSQLIAPLDIFQEPNRH